MHWGTVARIVHHVLLFNSIVTRYVLSTCHWTLERLFCGRFTSSMVGQCVWQIVLINTGQTISTRRPAKIHSANTLLWSPPSITFHTARIDLDAVDFKSTLSWSKLDPCQLFGHSGITDDNVEDRRLRCNPQVNFPQSYDYGYSPVTRAYMTSKEAQNFIKRWNICDKVRD